MSSGHSSFADLEREWKNTQGQWEATASTWRDEKASVFRDRSWSPLENLMPQVLEAMQAILQAIDDSQRIVPD